MAKQLFKLALTATTSTTTKPTMTNYFKIVSGTGLSGTTINMSAAGFKDNSGGDVSTFTTVISTNGFYQLFINGQLQQKDTYAVSGSKLILTYTENVSIYANTPITLCATKFTPASNTSIKS